ncbi:Sorting nexin mvp1 [Kappamyces sp. JEL0829]|nr:Sorting nexin mvp1 [Kappamyces sp. JEL0829]
MSFPGLPPSNPWDASSTADNHSDNSSTHGINESNIIHTSPLLTGSLPHTSLDLPFSGNKSSVLPPLQMEIPPSFYTANSLAEIRRSSSASLSRANSSSLYESAAIQGSALSQALPPRQSPTLDDDPWQTGALSRSRQAEAAVADHASSEETEGMASLSRSQTPKLREFQLLDHIQVMLSSGQKGLFGHSTYSVISTIQSNGPVYRRYSDFLWLQDVLLKKYPYRIITSLPPKKAVGVDSVFIERRRRGLSRFLNFVGNHPVLSLDPIFKAFLTSPLSVAEYKSSLNAPFEDEFTLSGQPDGSADTVPVEFDEQLVSFKVDLKFHMDQICEILNLLERWVARLVSTSSEYVQLGHLLGLASKKTQCLVSDCGKCAAFESNCAEVVGGLETISNAIQSESTKTSLELVETLKIYRDALSGFQQLLHRRELILPTLSLVPTMRRITVNKNKLVEMTAKGAARHDLDKVAKTIEQVRLLGSLQDEQEAEQQTSVAKFIRHCIWDEFDLLHSQKQQLAEFIQSCIRNRIWFASEHLEIWTVLTASIFQ